MIKIGLALCLAAGGLVAGCSHGQMKQQAASAGAAIGNTFADAYAAVRTGARETAQYGKYVLTRTETGAVRVYDASKSGLSAAGEATSDAYITTKIKTKLATEDEVQASDISVETSNGIVNLSGTVRSEAEAAKAIQEALDTNGVYAVNSSLAWPTAQAPPSVATPPSPSGTF